MHGFWSRLPPSDVVADRDDSLHRDGGAGSVTANGSGCPTFVAMVQARALPAQDGHLMSQGDEFELQRGTLRTRNETREASADRSVSMPMTV